MKCLYYLSPTLDMSQKVSDDLHEIGLSDWYLHTIGRDETGLLQKHINSNNYLETLDLYHGTTVGGILGFLFGLVFVGIAAYFEPFGVALNSTHYFLIILYVVLFGLWEGGLYGIDVENKKIKRFHNDIEAGKFLMLVYVEMEQEETIISMMKQKHPESKLVATDKHIINPFSKLKIV